MSSLRRMLLLSALAAGALFVAASITYPLSVLNFLATASGVEVRAPVTYGSGPRQQLDIYLPQRAGVQGGAAPTVVFFYGGSWRRGERADYRFAAAALARMGVIVAVPDYRVYPAGTYPEFLRDSAQAVAWVLEHARDYGGDPHRVFVMGHSAGAYNAAMLALDPRWLAPTGHTPDELAGLVGLAGPCNFLPIMNAEVKPVFDWPATAADTQPLAHVSRGAPPTLLISPVEDDLVDPIRNSAALGAALRSACVAVTLKRYRALNHYTALGVLAPALSWLAPIDADIAAFVIKGERGAVAPDCAAPRS